MHLLQKTETHNLYSLGMIAINSSAFCRFSKQGELRWKSNKSNHRPIMYCNNSSHVILFVPIKKTWVKKTHGTGLTLKHRQTYKKKTHTHTNTHTHNRCCSPTGGQTQIWKLGPDCCWDVGKLPTAEIRAGRTDRRVTNARKRERNTLCSSIDVSLSLGCFPDLGYPKMDQNGLLRISFMFTIK